MNISGWPYTIVVDGDVGLSAQAWITIDFKAQPSADSLGRIRYGIELFIALAEAGGLGGDRLHPLQCTAILSPKAPATRGERYAWELTTIAIDPRSLIVLFNMLTFLGTDIQAVNVKVPGSVSGASFSRDDLPKTWLSVPFYIDDDRSGPNVEVQIEFAQDVPLSLHSTVNDAIETWLSCGTVQGYRDWAAPDDSSFLMPISDPAFNYGGGNNLIGHFQDRGLAEECYDIFINVLIKLHATTPILSVDIL